MTVPFYADDYTALLTYLILLAYLYTLRQMFS
jgi:hypothetical protein